MTDTEKILYLRDLEEKVQEEEAEVNRVKAHLKAAKERFDAAVAELRSAIRREDDQQELEFTDQTPGSATDSALAPNPRTGDSDEEEQDDAA